MTKLRLSIHSDEYIWLRELLLNRRKNWVYHNVHLEKNWALYIRLLEK